KVDEDSRAADQLESREQQDENNPQKRAHSSRRPWKVTYPQSGCNDESHFVCESYSIFRGLSLHLFLVCLFFILFGGGGFLNLQPIFSRSPIPQIDHLASLTAKGAISVSLPFNTLFANRTFHGEQGFENRGR